MFCAGNENFTLRSGYGNMTEKILNAEF